MSLENKVVELAEEIGKDIKDICTKIGLTPSPATQEALDSLNTETNQSNT